MIGFPPPAPSSAWFAAWFAARFPANFSEGFSARFSGSFSERFSERLRPMAGGVSGSEAITAANKAVSIAGKDFARYSILSNGMPLTLSVAVAGGSGILKSASRIPSAALSEHGGWRRCHLGALEASYGRAPYYQHFIPLLKDAYLRGDTSLEGFNSSLFEAVVSFLMPDGAESVFHYACDITGISGAAVSRGREIASGINPAVSIIDPLMRFGPATLLALPHIS